MRSFLRVSRPSAASAGFSLPEALASVVIVGFLATIVTFSLKDTRTAIVSVKLQNDVSKLNGLVSLYQASGGSLEGATTPQQIIDRLKTISNLPGAVTDVGQLTGRQVDVRLAARMQTPSETASSAERIVWNPTTTKFAVATSGSGGVATFYYDDALADVDYGVETRTPTNVQYNADAGWVWSAAEPAAASSLNPLQLSLNNASNNFDPTYNPPGGSGGAVLALGAPVISPGTGSFVMAAFPSTATVNPGTAVLAYSALNYKIIHKDGSATDWAVYGGPVSLTYGDSLVAKNITTNALLYSDSPSVTATYTLIPTPLPTPSITPAGGSYLASSWPTPSILPNGAPAAASKISYKISHSDGSTTAWMDYASGAGLSITYGDTITAKNVSLDTSMYADSPTFATAYYSLTGSTKLPPPLFTDTTDSTGKRVVYITPDSSTIPSPAGARIYYRLDGVDPGASSSEEPLAGAILYDPTKPVAVPASTGGAKAKAKGSTTTAEFFEITARVYPPSSDKVHWDPSDPADFDISLDPGLVGGHIDVDTAHMIYPSGKGTTDGHVHAYDNKYNVIYVNMMGLADKKLRNIDAVIPAGTRFKLIISNGSLSPGGKLSINQTYSAASPSSYTTVTTYQNIPLASLPVYTTNGLAGTTKLNSLSMNFQTDTLEVGGLIGTVTGWVRGNKPGPNGEARDGALTLQAVAVNADGSPAFTTSLAQSNGGVHGVATSGLLWECTMFWHHAGGPY